MARKITYWEALSEAQVLAMRRDPGVFLYGVGVDDPKKIFGTTAAAFARFGPSRVFDTPVAENTLTGVAIGAALNGMRPVLIHARNDFMYYGFDQLINHASKWKAMFNGTMDLPLTIRAIIGKGWGQGAQHSQSLQALFAHIPGLAVMMPSCPADAKGLLTTAIEHAGPVICIEHRRLYDTVGSVPTGRYRLPFGKGRCVRRGRDVTVVATSLMVAEAQKAAGILAGERIDVEIIDPRWLKPLDTGLILESVRKTGRLVILDTAWKSYGVSAEIAAVVAERAFESLKAPVSRVALPDVPAPTSAVLEEVFYPSEDQILDAIRATAGRKTKGRKKKKRHKTDSFIGPF